MLLLLPLLLHRDRRHRGVLDRDKKETAAATCATAAATRARAAGCMQKAASSTKETDKRRQIKRDRLKETD